VFPNYIKKEHVPVNIRVKDSSRIENLSPLPVYIIAKI